MYLEALLAASAFVQGQAAEAGTPVPPTPEQDIVVTGEKDPRDKKVCKSGTPTGSIMVKKTCRTIAEWDAETEKSLQYKDKIDRQRQSNELTRFIRENSN